MAAICVVVYLVILWSVHGPAAVSGQCTALGCGAEYHGNDYSRDLTASGAEAYIEYRAQLDELKLQLQLVAKQLGMI